MASACDSGETMLRRAASACWACELFWRHLRLLRSVARRRNVAVVVVIVVEVAAAAATAAAASTWHATPPPTTR